MRTIHRRQWPSSMPLLLALLVSACRGDDNGDGDLDGHYAVEDERFTYTLVLGTASEVRGFDWSPPCGGDTSDRGRLVLDGGSTQSAWLEPDDGRETFGWPRADGIVQIEQLFVDLLAGSRRIHVSGVDVDGTEIDQTWALAEICEG